MNFRVMAYLCHTDQITDNLIKQNIIQMQFIRLNIS